MGLEAYAFWGTAAIPAIGPFLINLVVRRSEVLKSSGADFLLLLLAFDLTGLLAGAELAKFVPSESVKLYLPHFAVGSFILTLLLWLVVVQHFEPHYRSLSGSRKDLVKAISLFAVTWVLTALLTFAHVYVFAYGR